MLLKTKEVCEMLRAELILVKLNQADLVGNDWRALCREICT